MKNLFFNKETTQKIENKLFLTNTRKNSNKNLDNLFIIIYILLNLSRGYFSFFLIEQNYPIKSEKQSTVINTLTRNTYKLKSPFHWLKIISKLFSSINNFTLLSLFVLLIRTAASLTRNPLEGPDSSIDRLKGGNIGKNFKCQVLRFPDWGPVLMLWGEALAHSTLERESYTSIRRVSVSPMVFL